jgi:hypothetical protein
VSNRQRSSLLAVPCKYRCTLQAKTIELSQCSYVVLRNLEVDSRNLAGDCVNAHGVNHDITIDSLYIHGQGDDQQTIGISSNHTHNWSWIIRNTLIDGAGTGMYLGHSDGAHPFIAGLVENNLIMNTVGYNIEFKHQKPWPNIPGIPNGENVDNHPEQRFQ